MGGGGTVILGRFVKPIFLGLGGMCPLGPLDLRLISVVYNEHLDVNIDYLLDWNERHNKPNSLPE